MKPDTKKKVADSLEEAYPGFGRGEASPPPQGSSEHPQATEISRAPGADSTAKAGNPVINASTGSGDKSPPKQGDSEDPSYDEVDATNPETATKKIKGAAKPPKGGKAGHTEIDGLPMVTDKQGSETALQKTSKGNVAQEDSNDTLTQDEYDALSPEEKAEYEEVNDVEEAQLVTFEAAVLFDGDSNLTEEFKTKAASYFEACMAAREVQIREAVQNELSEQFVEAITEHMTRVYELVDVFLNNVAEQWLVENKVEVEHATRNDITERFITGLRGLFESHYIDIPEEKYDLIGDLESTIESLTKELEDSTAIAEDVLIENYELKDAQKAEKREQTLKSVSEGLALTQAEKFKTVVEGIEFTTEDEFRGKLTAVRNSMFSGNPAPLTQDPTVRIVSEEVKPENASNDPYVNSIVAQMATMTRNGFAK